MMEQAEYHSESELEWKPIESDEESERWLAYHKAAIKLYGEMAGVSPQIVTVHCYECNSTYETVFASKVTCPLCNTTNDCILEGTSTPEWRLRHS